MRLPLCPLWALHHLLPLPVTPRTPPRAPRRRPSQSAARTRSRQPRPPKNFTTNFRKECSSPSSGERRPRGRRIRDEASPTPYVVRARVHRIITVRVPRRSRSGPIAREKPESDHSVCRAAPSLSLRPRPPVRPAAASSSSAVRSSVAPEGPWSSIAMPARRGVAILAAPPSQHRGSFRAGRREPAPSRRR